MSRCSFCGGETLLPAGVSDPGDDSEDPIVGCYGPHDDETREDEIPSDDDDYDFSDFPFGIRGDDGEPF